MTKHGWFTHKGFRVQWLLKSPANRASFCDAHECKRRVERGEPRLRIDNQRGPTRKRGKGKNHMYICVDCAEAKGVPLADAGQTSLFNN